MTIGHHDDPIILKLPCDYCDLKVPVKDGWHEIVDEEGIEGMVRVPCPNEIQEDNAVV